MIIRVSNSKKTRFRPLLDLARCPTGHARALRGKKEKRTGLAITASTTTEKKSIDTCPAHNSLIAEMPAHRPRIR